MHKLAHWALQKWFERNQPMFAPDPGDYEIDTCIHVCGKIKIGQPYDGVYGLSTGITKLEIHVDGVIPKKSETRVRTSDRRGFLLF